MTNQKTNTPAYFGSPITRTIWGDLENIILIYAGSAADFALNPELDWLFFTHRLPDQPQARLLETFAYNQRLFFTPVAEVAALARGIRQIHTRVESARARAEGAPPISNRAFLQVSDMLIDYGVRGYQYLHARCLTDAECEAYYADMRQIGEWMHIEDLPADYAEWQQARERSVREHLAVNAHTAALYSSYRRDFGRVRVWLARRLQAQFVHTVVAEKLTLPDNPLVRALYRLYPRLRSPHLAQLALQFFFKRAVRLRLIEMMQVANSATSSAHAPT